MQLIRYYLKRMLWRWSRTGRNVRKLFRKHPRREQIIYGLHLLQTWMQADPSYQNLSRRLDDVWPIENDPIVTLKLRNALADMGLMMCAISSIMGDAE